MKAKFKLLAMATLLLVTTAQMSTAQDGTDNEFVASASYARLHRVDFGGPFNFLLQNYLNEKAIAVYSNTIPPVSALEINTNNSHIPGFVSLFYNRGEIFSTDAPVTQDAFWRFRQGANEIGNLFSLANSTNFNIQASAGHLKFYTPDPSTGAPIERLHIDGGAVPAVAGRIAIGNNLPNV